MLLYIVTTGALARFGGLEAHQDSPLHQGLYSRSLFKVFIVQILVDVICLETKFEIK